MDRDAARGRLAVGRRHAFAESDYALSVGCGRLELLTKCFSSSYSPIFVCS